MIDQAVYSVGSFTLTALVARAVDTASFGRFALTLAIFFLMQGVCRCLSNDPWTLVPETRTRFSPLTPLLSSACLSLLPVVSISVGALLSASTGYWLLFAAVFPLLVLQDCARLVAIGVGRAAAALRSDLAVLTAIGVYGVFFTVTAAGMLVAWACGCVVGVLLSMPTFAGGRWPLSYWRTHAPLIRASLAEFSLANATPQVAAFALAGLGSLSSVGSLRAAQTILGPVGVISTAAQTAAQPEVVRLRLRSDAAARQLADQVALLVAAAAVVAMTLALALPDALGTRLMGATWHSARSALLPVGLAMTASGLSVRGVLHLRATGNIRRIARVRLLLLVPGIIAVVLGSALDDARGAAWGLAVTGLSFAVLVNRPRADA